MSDQKLQFPISSSHPKTKVFVGWGLPETELKHTIASLDGVVSEQLI